MGTLKQVGLIVAALGAVVASGLVAQTGQSAPIEREVDEDWLDRSLVGADPGSELRIVDMLPCEDCGSGPAPVPTTAEARLIAERLDEVTVPLLRIDGPNIGYLDMAQIEQPSATALR